MQPTFLIPTILFSSVAVIVLSGCINPGPDGLNTTTRAPISSKNDATTMSLVANDFVNAMRQIPTLVPASTTVHLLRTQMADGLIQAFKENLEQAGYGVRWIDEPSSGKLLQYRREDVRVTGAPDRMRLDIAVGDIELRRSYNSLTVNQVEPVTPLYVRGADATNVVLDDAAFFVTGGRRPIKPSTLTVPNSINPLSGMVASVSDANAMTIEKVTSPNDLNVFDLGESNYLNVLSEHGVVVEQVLTFPNDSLRMGATNKQLLNALVTRFDPATDLLSVVGCSIGPTKLKNGNAALARGRASRVREALLFAGVDPRKILDEGCWAGDGPSTLPRRGVVVTLNRQFR